MKLEERNIMLKKVREFDDLTKDLDKLKKFKEQITKSRAGVLSVEIFGTIGGGVKEVPGVDELGERLQQVMVEEVDRHIEKKIKELERL